MENLYDVKLYIVKVSEEISKSDFDCLLKFVDKEKQERILRQKIKQNAYNILIGDILTRIAIKDSFVIPLHEMKFSAGEFGKPYLSSHPHIHFNVSNSGEYVICATANVPIGADIEKKREYNPRLAEKVCSQKETEQIEICSDKSSEFTKLWTKKEAVLKMYGTGITNSDIKNCLDGEYTQTILHDGYYISIAMKK